MPELPPCVSNDNSIPAPKEVPNSCDASQPKLRVVPLLRERVEAELPATLLQWLYDGVDRNDSEVIGAEAHDFEATLAERLFPAHDPRVFMQRLRIHCRTTGVTARVVARRAGLTQLDTVFAVGWLHDVGLAIQLRQLDPLTFASENGPFRQVWPTLLRGAAEQAVRLACRWRLPSSIRYALRDHVSFGTIHSVNPAASATFVAEHLAGCMGFGFRDEQPTSGLRFALNKLHLSERDLVAMARRAESLLGHETYPGFMAFYGERA